MIKVPISKITPSKTKRGINEIGTIWKWIAGIPNHDNNNNDQFVINSKLFKEIRSLSEEFKVAFKNREIPLRNKQERYSRVPRLSDTRYSA